MVSPTSQSHVSNDSLDVQQLMEEANGDPQEFLMRLQQTRDKANRREAATGHAGESALSSMNQFSRPMMSKEAPLRSLFLDPKVNNLPKSKTQSMYRKKLHMVNQPHISYDIDGDGYVSQEDYWLSKRFDLDGNGVLDPEEQEIGRFIMAQEFFGRHRDDIHLFGDEWKNSEKDNIKKLATSMTFTKKLTELKSSEKHFRDIGSHALTEALQMENKALLKHNFFTNKFDTTAWNDFGANPRPGDYASTTHLGSRHKLFNQRNIKARDYCTGKLHQAEMAKPQYSKRRTSMLTNWKIENG